MPGGAALAALAVDCLNRSGIYTAPAQRIVLILQPTSARTELISLEPVLLKITLGASQWSRVGERRAGAGNLAQSWAPNCDLWKQYPWFPATLRLDPKDYVIYGSRCLTADGELLGRDRRL